MRGAPSPLSGLLARCLDRVAGTDGATTIWRAWEDAVGAQIADRAQPVRLRGRTLVVAVSSASWMQELQLLKPTLRAAINERLQRPLVGDLFFVLAEDAAMTPASDTVPTPIPTARCAPPPKAVDLSTLPAPLRRSFDDLLAAWRRRAGA